MALTKITDKQVTTKIGSVVRNLHLFLGDYFYSAFNDMSAAQVASVQARDGLQDVTTALQTALTYCTNNNKTLYLPSGTYKISSTLVKPGAYTCPNIIGENYDSTILSYAGIAGASALQLVGGSGALCGAVIEGIQFTGSATSNGIEIQGQCGVKIKHCQFKTNAIGILFHNSALGSFSEYNVAEFCDFHSTCLQAAQYKVSLGNDSFHGSGLKDCTVNSTGTQAVVEIGAGAFVYNAPLSLQVWPSANTTLIKNNVAPGTRRQSFHGTITLESGGANIITCASTNSVYLAGEVEGVSENNVLGTLILADIVQINSDASMNAVLKQQSKKYSLVAGGNNTYVVPTESDSVLITLRIVGVNYDYVHQLVVNVDLYGGNGTVAELANARALNTAGWGKSTFSVTGSTLVVTNANFTGTVTGYITATQIGQRIDKFMSA